MLCEPVCHRLSGRNQSKKKHACQADVLFHFVSGVLAFQRLPPKPPPRPPPNPPLRPPPKPPPRLPPKLPPPPKPPPRLLPPKPPKFPLPKPPPRPLLPNPPKLLPEEPEGRLGCWGGRRLPPEEPPLRGGSRGRPVEDGGRPNGADAGRAEDGVPRRWGDTSPSARPCRASCSGGDSGDNACHQA